MRSQVYRAALVDWINDIHIPYSGSMDQLAEMILN